MYLSIIANVVTLAASQATQFADQVISRLISQVIRGISRVLRKLLKYFNGTAISTFISPALPVLFLNLDLNLNDSESVLSLSFGSSLYLYYIKIIHWYHNIKIFDIIYQGIIYFADAFSK